MRPFSHASCILENCLLCGAHLVRSRKRRVDRRFFGDPHRGAWLREAPLMDVWSAASVTLIGIDCRSFREAPLTGRVVGCRLWSLPVAILGFDSACYLIGGERRGQGDLAPVFSCKSCILVNCLLCGAQPVLLSFDRSRNRFCCFPWTDFVERALLCNVTLRGRGMR